MTQTPVKTSFAHGQLRAIVERIERLIAEKNTISDDIKEVYLEAKGNGFDVKVLRHVITLRNVNPEARAELDSMVDVYLAALGKAVA